MNGVEQLPVLAIDIGGTKILAAQVQGGRVIKSAQTETNRNGKPDTWLQQSRELAATMDVEFKGVAITVTGLIRDGKWSTLNAETLTIPEDYPLVQAASDLFACPAIAVNDAQAAAWAEYQFGSGRQRDMVFLTVSTGIGGGIVLNGQLLNGASGLAGHYGQWRTETGDRLESAIAGRWFAHQLQKRGLPFTTAREAFASAAAGDNRATELIRQSAERLASLCLNIQLTIDPEVIVIGGGIGLANGYLTLVCDFARKLTIQGARPPLIEPAYLGANAGVAGVGDLWLRAQDQ